MAATVQEVALELQRVITGMQRKGMRLVFSGRRLDAYNVTMTGAPANRMYVRYPDESREETTVWGRVASANIPLWVGPSMDGTGEELKGIAWELGTAIFGDALMTLIQAPLIAELLPQSFSGLGFAPGRLGPSEDGGTKVHVAAFQYDGGAWAGGTDLDVAAHIPSSGGNYRRVGIYYDPDDDTLYSYNATDEAFGYDVLDDPDFSLVPDGTYPIGAVTVRNGETISSATEFIDARLHFAIKGVRALAIAQSTASVSNPPTAAELDSEFGSVADGFTAVIDSGASGTEVWYTRRVNSTWFYVGMTAAT